VRMEYECHSQLFLRWRFKDSFELAVFDRDEQIAGWIHWRGKREKW